MERWRTIFGLLALFVLARAITVPNEGNISGDCAEGECSAGDGTSGDDVQQSDMPLGLDAAIVNQQLLAYAIHGNAANLAQLMQSYPTVVDVNAEDESGQHVALVVLQRTLGAGLIAFRIRALP